MQLRLSLSALLSVAWLLLSVQAVKRHDFKTCSQSGFCRRNRALADRQSANKEKWTSPYVLSDAVFDAAAASFKATLKNVLFPTIQFSWEIRFQDDGTARVLMDEVNGLRQRYNEAASWSLVRQPMPAHSSQITAKLGKNAAQIAFTPENSVDIQYNPLTVTFLRDGQPHLVLNERGLLNMEHFRLRQEAQDSASDKETPDMLLQPETPASQYTSPNSAFNMSLFLETNEDGMWEESFGGKKDSKPKGPESLGMDITFPGYEHVYGIPEHSGPLSLRTTRGGDNAFTDPYRLFNLDVFEYEHDSEMALYGAIPFMQAQRPGSSVALLWLNGAETWIDIEKNPTNPDLQKPWQRRKTRSNANSRDKGPSDLTTTTHWASESGILDLFVFLGPTSESIYQQYGRLVGTTAMPQYFAIGYHQCRWNYLTQEDVLEVSAKFDEHDIPMDVLWLDIEYAEEHKYFQWDRNNFPEPLKMLDGLADRGRQLVAIVDPHIKRASEFYVYKEAQQLDILCKTPEGSEFEGWCWTGSSSWVDFFNPKSWDWWNGLFKFNKFKDSARNLFVWNDMNEPSVFNGPEITIPKDTIFHGGWENRDIHNINGMLYHNATSVALIKREDPPRRPFVLSRSYFVGSQRVGAIWTGDNLGTWEHVAVSLPMILSNSVAGMSYVGADVGGFFGNPSEEMLIRWYQAGIFAPFFRAHAHIDTKRREPYLFEGPTMSRIRDMIRLRYILLPALYTAFWDSHRLGVPIATPHYVKHPDDAAGFAVDDQYFIGNTGLLVKPITTEGITSTSVFVSDDQPYYNYFTNQIFVRSAKTSRFEATASLDTVPLFLQGGSVLPRRDLVRRSATLMQLDPVSLVIATDNANSAQGTLYLDDGDGYSFEKGDFVWRRFAFDGLNGKNFVLTSTEMQHEEIGAASQLYKADSSSSWVQKAKRIQVETITILGLAKKPDCIRSSVENGPLYFTWTDGAKASGGSKSHGQTASILTIQGRGFSIASDWQINIDYSGDSCLGARQPSLQEQLSSPLCPANHFRCANKGHIPACILTSRVNDGLCDPECCDGSDETDGKAQCPNRCAQVNAEYTKRKDEEGRKTRVGAKLRQEYIAFGSRERAAIEASISRLENVVVGLRTKERDLQQVLQQAEARGQQDIEMKKASAVYRRLDDHQAAFKALRMQRESLQAKVDHLAALLRDLQGSYNPNYQDMAVKGAVKAFEEWENSQTPADTDSEDENDNVADSADVPSDEDLKAYEEEDILALLDNSQVVGFASSSSINHYLPAAILPQYQNAVKATLALLQRIGVLPVSAAADTGDRPDVARARAAHSTAQSELRDSEKQLDDEKANLGKDWGRDWEWKKLDGTCIEKNTGEYTYELCFFGNARQKANKGHATTNLGKFSSWHLTAVKSHDTYYNKQRYDGGQRCWNGPERSVNVEITCGTKNELVSVAEPEKCEYQYKVTSPAVCYPPENSQIEGKQEL